MGQVTIKGFKGLCLKNTHTKHSRCIDLLSAMWSDLSQISLRGYLLIQCTEKFFFFTWEALKRNFLDVQKVAKDEALKDFQLAEF